MLQISQNRFKELGLGFDCEACGSCEDSCIINNELHCSQPPNISVKDAAENFSICPCVDEERLELEMTEEEYDAYRHGRLTVSENDSDS